MAEEEPAEMNVEEVQDEPEEADEKAEEVDEETNTEVQSGETEMVQQSNNEASNTELMKNNDKSGGSNQSEKDGRDEQRSFFAQEQKAAYAWVGWTIIYWTLVMIIPTLIRLDFGNPGFAMWCAGFFACLACMFSFRAGLYPSGATEERMNAYDGRGRYAAFALLICLAADFCGLAFYALNDGTKIDQYFRAVCHWISMIWGSLFYFNRFLRKNRDVAIYAFPLEWLDIMFTILVIFLLYNGVNDDNDDKDRNCWSKSVCVVYFVFLCVQLGGWLGPMALIPNWGAQPNAKGVALHLFALDLCTNIPIVFTICITEGYKYHPIVFIDALYKTIGLVRSSAYYMVYYVWLDKGLFGTLKAAQQSLGKKDDARPGVPASNEIR